MNKISKDKQYKTRGDREVRIYATDCGGIYPVHGAIKGEHEWVPNKWSGDGKFELHDHKYDLIEVKPKMKFERWALVERNGGYSLWLDKPSNASSVDAFAITRISFEAEEGEGLDAIDSISNADLIEVKPRKKIERWIAIDSHGSASMYLSNPPEVVTTTAFAVKHIVFEVEEGEGIEDGSN